MGDGTFVETKFKCEMDRDIGGWGGEESGLKNMMDEERKVKDE